MAEEGFKQSPGENALFWAIIWLFIIFTGLNFLTGGRFSDSVPSGGGSTSSSPFSFFNIFGGSPSLSEDTPLGTRIVHEADTVVYADAGGEQKAVAPAGSRGSIIGGPVNINGREWWQVRYTNGIEGWVPGNSVSVDSSSNNLAVTNRTPIGSRITNTRELTVTAQPGAGQELGIRPKGAQGTILERGVAPDGTPVWRVDYDFGPDGWVAQDGLEIDPTSNASAVTEATPVGSRVLSDDTLTVRSEPRRTSPRVSDVRNGIGGTITDGPAQVDGEIWFEVEFTNGVKGWVLREDLALDTVNDPFAVKDTTPLGIVVEHIEPTTLWSEPGGGREIGKAERGVQGTLVDGPVVFEGERWWQVDYGDGNLAWVQGESLEIVTSKSRKRIRQSDTGIGGIDPEKPGGGFLRFLRNLGIILSLFFVIGILYVTVKLNSIRAKESKDLKFEEEKYVAPSATTPRNIRWESIIEHINSDNENDWRVAIMDADSMLDEMMTALGYRQDSLGEKLKAVEKSDFTTIELAWEAHKFRNMIAHEGAGSALSQREARRIIDLYKKVFEEFELI